jgi:hypothetical protein
MSQKILASPNGAAAVQKDFENVNESWVLYDTVLVSGLVNSLQQHDGYFPSFGIMANTTSIPFFNVRNRNHGLAYNNQDTRDQLPYVMKIYSVGVSFFSPSTVLYRDNAGAPLGAQRTELDLFETELPKHMSLTLTTNQDDRLKIGALLTPPGYGMMVSGVSQGDIESVSSYPGVTKASWCQGMPELTNKWGFRKPLEIPRRANLSVRLDISEYGRNLLDAMPGPFFQFFQNSDSSGAYVFKWGMCGIQVTIGGIREVQQRGQYHA